MFPYPVDTSRLRPEDHRHAPAFAELLPDVIRAEPGAVIDIEEMARQLRAQCKRHRIPTMPTGAVRRLVFAAGFDVAKDPDDYTRLVRGFALVDAPHVARGRG